MLEHCRIVIMVLRSAICRGQYTLRDIRPWGRGGAASARHVFRLACALLGGGSRPRRRRSPRRSAAARPPALDTAFASPELCSVTARARNGGARLGAEAQQCFTSCRSASGRSDCAPASMFTTSHGGAIMRSLNMKLVRVRASRQKWPVQCQDRPQRWCTLVQSRRLSGRLSVGASGANQRTCTGFP